MLIIVLIRHIFVIPHLQEEIVIFRTTIFLLSVVIAGPDAVARQGGESLDRTSMPRIVFETDRDGDHEIYVMNADGSNQVNLTNNPALDAAPVWSPDGSRVAFASDRDGGNRNIWVMNADGSGLVKLTNFSGGAGYPTWSPDSSMISFDSGSDIYRMNADGSEQNNLTNNEKNEGYPSWSPDGAWITFDAGGYEEFDADTYDNDVTGNFAIYAISVADGAVVQVTDLSGNSGDASWHPDSLRLVYSSNKDGAEEGNYEIYMINVDGSGDRKITRADGADTDPSVSHDGSKVAFDSDRDGDSEIYVVSTDGTGTVQLTVNSAWDGMPSWSPW